MFTLMAQALKLCAEMVEDLGSEGGRWLLEICRIAWIEETVPEKRRHKRL